MLTPQFNSQIVFLKLWKLVSATKTKNKTELRGIHPQSQVIKYNSKEKKD